MTGKYRNRFGRRKFNLKEGDVLERIWSNDENFVWDMTMPAGPKTTPAYVVVLKEFPDLFLVEAHFITWGRETSYKTSINKFELANGDVTFRKAVK